MKTTGKLLEIIGQGVMAKHDMVGHKREPRPETKGFWGWWNQPINMDIILDPKCRGCRAIEAYSQMKKRAHVK